MWRIALGAALFCLVVLPPLLHFAAQADWPSSLRIGAWSGFGVGAVLMLFWGADRAMNWVFRKLSGLGKKPLTQAQRSEALARMAATLDAIEAEMRQIGYWQNDPPDLQALVARGEIRSDLDAPSFELWLQCIFLPNARAMVREDRLPPSSSVGVMAMRQYDYHSYVEEALALMRLLQRFDDQANAYVGHDPLNPTSA